MAAAVWQGFWGLGALASSVRRGWLGLLRGWVDVLARLSGVVIAVGKGL